MNVHLVNDSLTVANRIRPVLLKLNRELRREVHSLGVSGYQVSLLVAIKQAPGIGVRALAAQERLSPGGISQAVARLERAGLVRRTPDASDRRRHGLTLTRAGEGVLRSVKRRRTAWLAGRLDQLTRDERAAIDAAVEPLARLLGEEASP
ncbi:MAG: MarR family transcriptional regulator [Thermoleophilia bacterium]|nr:MarR family transcriptional regulator [Thermoleophilia bacterium]